MTALQLEYTQTVLQAHLEALRVLIQLIKKETDPTELRHLANAILRVRPELKQPKTPPTDSPTPTDHTVISRLVRAIEREHATSSQNIQPPLSPAAQEPPPTPLIPKHKRTGLTPAALMQAAACDTPARKLAG